MNIKLLIAKELLAYFVYLSDIVGFYITSLDFYMLTENVLKLMLI